MKKVKNLISKSSVHPRWACRDRRYKIKKSGTSELTKETRESSCKWNTEYTDPPAVLECHLKYCDNLTDSPAGTNLNFIWEGNRRHLNSKTWYPCNDGMALRADTDWKTSSTGLNVKCRMDGQMEYPSPWPTCVEPVCFVQTLGTPQM